MDKLPVLQLLLFRKVEDSHTTADKEHLQAWVYLMDHKL